MKHRSNIARLLVWGVMSLSAAHAYAQAPATSPPPANPNGIKAFKDVITAQAKSDEGLFTVHRIEEKVFYEIPNKLLGKEMLLVSRQAKTPQDGYGGEQAQSESVIRWERKFNRILLRAVPYTNVASDSLPIAKAVKNGNFEEVLASFTIQAYNKDTTGVIIDVSSLFTTDVGLLTPAKAKRDAYRISALDGSRSYIDYVRSFPENIEVENVLTYSADNAPQNPASRTMSFTMHHSMVKLPEKPMMPRFQDSRVGYFFINQTDYGMPTQRAEKRTYIRRWRLEPKDDAAFARGELVEPKKPITYYIDPATPAQWRPALKKGVEMWNVAFEQAGFKNAIRCIDAPSAKEDPEWSPEDARYSVIRYYPSPIENAYGPNVIDPRTGEILESDIGWFHNVMNLLRNWYFVQAVADPRTKKLPLPDSLMSELVTFVSAHEVGHTLGFPHNMKASNAYPVDSLRSKTFTEKFGTAPSIMDYARFNYVAQPGDGAAMMPKVGPYDLFATKWGYRPIPSAKTPDEELDSLNKWARLTETNKMYRFGAQQFGGVLDPFSQTEDLGDDAMKSTAYGIKNLERVMQNLVDAPAKEGLDYDELKELYNEVLGQWLREIIHVANYPGGVDVVFKTYGQTGDQYTPLPKAKQREAVQFVAENAWKAPKMFLRDDVLRKIQPSGAIKQLMDAQARTVRTMVSNDKLLRLVEHEATGGANAYSVKELYNDMETALFAELKQGKPDIDAYRRNLQRAYVNELGAKFAPVAATPIQGFPQNKIFSLILPPDVSNTDVRSLSRLQLDNLKNACQSASSKAANDATKAHLKDIAAVIDNILNPKK